MSRPRVAMVLNAPGLGGVTEVVYHLLDRLPRDRFDLKLFYLKGSDTADADRRGRMDRLTARGIETAAASGIGGKIGAVADLSAWLIAQRIDILHTHSFRPNLYGRMAGVLCRHAGIRLIAHYHNHYDDKWREDAAALPLERSLAPSTDAMIAVSRQVAEHVAKSVGIARDGIEVIENGVDAERFAGIDRAAARKVLGLDPNAMTIGLVGRVCEQKGQTDLVEAAVLLTKAQPNLHFVVFGDIEDKTLHSRLVRRLGEAGLDRCFTFMGHVADTPAAFASSDIVVAPSRWEGFPLVVAEAMAAGRPIVAAGVGAVPDMLRDGATGVVVPPRDPARLADAIATLIAAPQRRNAMAAAARDEAARFSWQRASDRVAEIYDVLCPPHAA